ncbi:MAG: DUF342 domain-containing protein [Gammaproteobacteria bacterium]|nr:DUF342 domain-containing protein [Gammaproteobacteria bacterium]
MLADDSLIFADNLSEISIKITSQSTEIKAVEISQLIGRQDVGHMFVIEENIIKAADLINIVTKEPSSEGDETAIILIAKRIDASINIEVSDDKMKAYAIITAPFGGEYISFSDFIIAVSQNKLTVMVGDNEVDQFLDLANAATPGKKNRLHICSGTAAINGEDSYFEFLVDTMERRIIKPQAAKNGKVNMRELGDILTVKQGCELIRRHPPTPGREGSTVLMTPIAPIAGQSQEFCCGDGTEVCGSDNNLLIASRVGIPRLSDNTVAIDDILVVDNVDVSFGNIRFDGSVMIAGDVCEGLKVISSGTITVGGSVNSATLEAQGSIIVKNGIFGKKINNQSEQHSCVINAAGAIDAKFIQYCEVTAGKDIKISTHILHSHVTTLGNITVSNSTGNKGTISGGHVSAGAKILAVELGGNSGNRTYLTIVGALPELRVQASQLNKSLQQEHDQLKQLLVAHEKIGHLKPSDKKTKLLQQLKQNVDKKIAMVVDVQAQKNNNDNAIKSLIKKSEINSSLHLKQGVILNIDGKKIITKQDYKATSTRITLTNKLLINLM